MKCRNCGGDLHGLTCPVCGHKQFKKVQCTVCYTNIFPGQEYCPRCGSPTIYRRKDEVKKITPDTIYHSEESHNYHTVSESYDYKKNAYHYQEQTKKPTFSSLLKSTKQTKKTYQKKNKVVPIFLTVLSAVLILVFATSFILFEVLHNAGYTFQETTSLDHFSYINTSQDEYNDNVNQESLAYVYDEKMYICQYDGIYVFEEGKKGYKIVDSYDCRYLYVNDEGLYYVKNNIFNVYRDNQVYELISDVEKCYQYGQSVIYKNSQNELYYDQLDDTQQEAHFIAKDVDDFYVDDVNQRVLVYNEGYYKLYDFQGQVLKNDFDFYQYERPLYFRQGALIYKERDYIYYDDLKGNSESFFSCDEDCYRFAFTYHDNQPCLFVLNDDDEFLGLTLEGEGLVEYYIEDDVERFYVSGGQTIYYLYDDDYNRVYYIANIEGERAFIH